MAQNLPFSNTQSIIKKQPLRVLPVRMSDYFFISISAVLTGGVGLRSSAWLQSVCQWQPLQPVHHLQERTCWALCAAFLGPLVFLKTPLCLGVFLNGVIIKMIKAEQVEILLSLPCGKLCKRKIEGCYAPVLTETFSPLRATAI